MYVPSGFASKSNVAIKKSKFVTNYRGSSKPLRFYESQYEIQQQSQRDNACDEIERIHELSSRKLSKALISQRESAKNRTVKAINKMSFMRASIGISVVSYWSN
jgi:hypothetical protein